MNPIHLALALELACMGLIFMTLAVVFSVKKEKACKLVGGFNFLTEAQQARYDRARIARDYARLFKLLAIVVFAGGALCLLLGWWAFATAMASMLFLLFRDFHWDPEKAFAKYKIDP